MLQDLVWLFKKCVWERCIINKCSLHYYEGLILSALTIIYR